MVVVTVYVALERKADRLIRKGGTGADAGG